MTLKKFIACAVSTVFLATSAQAVESKGKVLVVLPAAKKLQLKNGKSVPTGYNLAEFAIPAQKLIEAGYEVTVATPGGAKPTIDKNSKDVSQFSNDKESYDQAQKFVKTYPGIKNIKSLKKVAGEVDQYVGIYIPGGHAPLADLITDADLGAVLKHFHDNEKPTALLCHGPAALLSTLPNAEAYKKALAEGNLKAAKEASKNWLYDDYNMTAYSNAEEKVIQRDVFKGELEFFLVDALKGAGADVKTSDKGKGKVVEDEELITGQNVASIAELTEEFIEALNEKTDD